MQPDQYVVWSLYLNKKILKRCDEWVLNLYSSRSYRYPVYCYSSKRLFKGRILTAHVTMRQSPLKQYGMMPIPDVRVCLEDRSPQPVRFHHFIDMPWWMAASNTILKFDDMNRQILGKQSLLYSMINHLSKLNSKRKATSMSNMPNYGEY